MASDDEMRYRNDSAARKGMPLHRGVLRYFPAALSLVAVVSRKGNDKHNPGQEMHHARGKSMDHGDCILRHQADVGTIDPEIGLDHAAMVAWRALAQLQELAETRYGWPTAPGARMPEPPPVNAVSLSVRRAGRPSPCANYPVCSVCG